MGRNLERLNGYLREIDSLIPDLEKRNDKISKVDIAWQLDHSLNVLIKIIGALKESNEGEYSPNTTTWWAILSTLHWIPRGKGRSPKVVLPNSEISESSLHSKLKEARALVSDLKGLPQNAFFKHPYFGNLNLKRAIRFMGMHTQHHLKICRDILKD